MAGWWRLCVCVWGGGGGGSEGVSGSSAQSDPQKTEEAVDHRQNDSYVRAVGTSAVRSN